MYVKYKIILGLAAILFVVSAILQIYSYVVIEAVMPLDTAIMVLGFTLVLVGLLLAAFMEGAKLWQEHPIKSLQFYLTAVGILLGQKLLVAYSSLPYYMLTGVESRVSYSNFDYWLTAVISMLTIVVPLIFAAAAVKKTGEIGVNIRKNYFLATVLSLRGKLKEVLQQNKIHPVVAIIAIVVPISILATEAGLTQRFLESSRQIYYYVYQGGYLLGYLVLAVVAMVAYRQTMHKFFLMLGLVGIVALSLHLVQPVNNLLFQTLGSELRYSSPSMAYARLVGFIMFFGAIFQPMFIFLAIKNWK